MTTSNDQEPVDLEQEEDLGATIVLKDGSKIMLRRDPNSDGIEICHDSGDSDLPYDATCFSLKGTGADYVGLFTFFKTLAEA